MPSHRDIERRLLALDDDIMEATLTENEGLLSRLQEEYSALTRELLGDL